MEERTCITRDRKSLYPSFQRGAKKVLLFFLILFTILPCIATEAKDDNVFFAQVTTGNKNNEIIAGDSTVFSIWLYSLYPIRNIKCEKNDFKIHHCNISKVTSSQRQSRRYINNKLYYCTLWGQYVISSNKKGTYTFPPLDFTATLYIQVQDDIDPFDPFGFFSQPKYKKTDASTSTPSTKFSIIEEPLKTTEELLKSGKTVI